MKRPRRVTEPLGIPLGKALSFMRLLWAVDHGLQRISKRMSAELGVTGPQRLVLRVVGRLPGIAPGALAGVLLLHPSTVTVIIQNLERDGLLERIADPADRRRARLRSTPAGRKVAASASGTVEQAMRRALARFPATALDVAGDVLTAVAEELEKTGTPRTEPRGQTWPPGRSASRRSPRTRRT